MTAAHPSTSSADAEALLVHAPFLRALARSLLGAGHPDDADDVVQEAYLRAAERPPRDVEAGRGWLATVVKRLVAERGRREPRRSRWERAAARREALPSTEEIVEREAVRRRVVDAVVALDEPYRTAILLRFYEDLPPRAIADHLGVPVETVRTRVKRGIAQLRGRLDEAHGGDRSAWGLALAPLAWPSSAKAASLAWLPIAPKTVALAATVVLVAFTAWRVFGTGETATSTEPAQLASAAFDPGPAAPLVVDEGRDAPQRLEPAPGFGARLAFDVTGVGSAAIGDHVVALTGCPVPDVAAATTLPRSEIIASLETRVARTSDAGRAVFDGVPQGIWVVSTAASDDALQGLHGAVVVLDPGLPAGLVVAAVQRAAARIGLDDVVVRAAVSDGELDVALALPAGERVVRGEVVDIGGDGIDGADVAVLPAELVAIAEELGTRVTLAAFAPTLARTATDAAGRFTTRVGDDADLRASAPGHVAEQVDVAPPGDDVSITLERGLGFSVAGRVVTRNGEPVAGALVSLSAVAPLLPDHARFVDNVERFGKVHTTTDDEGAYAFDDVQHLAARDGRATELLSESDPTFFVGASTDGCLPTFARALVVDGSAGTVDVTLASGGPMEGLVTLDRRGDDMSLTARGPDGKTFGTSLWSPDGEPSSFTHFRATHGAWRFVVEIDGQQSDELLVDWRGEVVELDPTFSTPTWIVEVDVVGSLEVGSDDERDANLAPHVAIGPLRSPPGDRVPNLFDASDDVDGRRRVVLGHDWDDADEVWIAATCDGALLDVAHVRRGERLATLDVGGARSLRGGLVVDVSAVSDATGIAPRVTLYPSGGHVPRETLVRTRLWNVRSIPSNPLLRLFGKTDETRKAEVYGRIAPGRYDVLVTPLSEGDGTALLRDVVVEAGRVTRLTPEPTPTTHVVFATPDSAGAPHRFALFDAEGRRRIARGPATMPLAALLPRGTYTVHAMTDDGRAGQATFTVDGRDTQRVVVRTEPAAPTTITVAPRALPDDATIRVAVVDALGNALVDVERRAHAGVEPLVISLATGTYSVTLEIDDVEVARRDVTSGGSAPLAIVFPAD